MDKTVYIGAGHDIIPVIIFPEIKEFIYIDSEPKTEYRGGVCYNRSFVPRLVKLFEANNFVCRSKSENYIEFTGDGGRSVKYYINTIFPDNVSNDIKKELACATNLIVCGYDPHKNILNLMPALQTIICNTHTCYSLDRSEYNDKEMQESLILELHEKRFKYKLMKENNPYEYWNHKNIIHDIKNNYTIYDLKSLDEIDAFKRSA